MSLSSTHQLLGNRFYMYTSCTTGTPKKSTRGTNNDDTYRSTEKHTSKKKTTHEKMIQFKENHRGNDQKNQQG